MAQLEWPSLELENELVKLLTIKAKDFEALYAIACDPLLWEQHPQKERYKIEVFRAFFDEAIKCNSTFVIIDKSSGNMIGSTRYYQYDKENSSIVIGYTFLSRNYWGGKYNWEIKKLMLNHAFKYVNKVYFHIGANNLRSQIATKRLGATKAREFNTLQANNSQLNYEFILEKTKWLEMSAGKG